MFINIFSNDLWEIDWLKTGRETHCFCIPHGTFDATVQIWNTLVIIFFVGTYWYGIYVSKSEKKNIGMCIGFNIIVVINHETLVTEFCENASYKVSWARAFEYTVKMSVTDLSTSKFVIRECHQLLLDVCNSAYNEFYECLPPWE